VLVAMGGCMLVMVEVQPVAGVLDLRGIEGHLRHQSESVEVLLLNQVQHVGY